MDNPHLLVSIADTVSPPFLPAWSACAETTYLASGLYSRQPINKFISLSTRRWHNSNSPQNIGNCHLVKVATVVEYLNDLFGTRHQSEIEAFTWSVRKGHLDVCQFLKQWGVRLRHIRHASDGWGIIGNGVEHVHVLQFLKDWVDPDGFRLTLSDVRTRDNCAFGSAAGDGYLESLRLLRDWRDKCGARLTIKDVREKNNHAMRMAAYFGHVHVLQFLQDWEDNPFGVTKGHAGKKSGCLQNGHCPLVSYRLTLKDVRWNKNEALCLAADHGHVDVLQFFKDWRDTHPNGTVSRLTIKDVRAEGNLLFRTAVVGGHVHILKFLKNWRDDHVAYTSAHTNRLTINDVRALDNYSLRWAAEYNHVDILQFLKDWQDPNCFGGARLTLKDVRALDNYALQMAAKNGHVRVLRFLRAWVDPDTGDHLTHDDVLTSNALTIARQYRRGKAIFFLEGWLSGQDVQK